MEKVSGVTRRTLLSTPRKATERFRLSVDDDDRWRLDEGEVIIDEFRFDYSQIVSPVVIYSRVIDRTQAEVLSARISPREVYVAPVPEPLEEVDARGHEPLPDDEFWAVIDLLGGKAWETRLAKAQRALAKHPEDYALRFAQAMAEKVRALDHPLNFNVYGDDGPLRLIAPGDYGSRFGAIMAGGRERYERVLAEPGLRDPKWSSDLSFMVLHLASSVLARNRGRQFVLVTTSWNYTDIGTNRENWDNSGFELRERPPTPPPTPEQEAQHAALVEKIIDDWVARTGEERDFNPYAPNGVRKAWFCVHYFVDCGEYALEQFALHVALSGSGPELDHDVATLLAARAGGELLGSARGGETLMKKFESHPFVTQIANSSLSQRDYVRTRIDGREA